MSSFTLRDIGLRPAQLSAVQKKARDAGTTAPEYVRLLVERHLLSHASFDKILRPIREDFERSGITEGQLDEIVKRARQAQHSPRGESNAAFPVKTGKPRK